MEIKELGIYVAGNGRRVEIYEIKTIKEFDHEVAEGFFIDDRAIEFWHGHSGKSTTSNPDYDLVKFEGPTPNE